MENNAFIRTEMLIGTKNLEKLKKSHIAIFGLGGVGGYAFEALVRCGIENFDVFDNDVIDLSNINRQILAVNETIGMKKTIVAQKRAISINSKVNVNCFEMFILDSNIDKINFSKYDYVIDAIDTVNGKLAIIEQAVKSNVKVISSMGTGSKLNPLDLKLTDIYKTKECPLAKVMRSELKKRNIKKLKVCYSEEKINGCKIDNPPIKNNGRPCISSISFVPSCAGLIIASEVVKDIIKE